MFDDDFGAVKDKKVIYLTIYKELTKDSIVFLI